MLGLERRIEQLERTRGGACLDCEIENINGPLGQACTHQRMSWVQHIQQFDRYLKGTSHEHQD